MSTINILGIDIGKFTFHLVGHDLSGREVYRKKLSRPKLIQFISTSELTTIAMEACGGCHWLARKCQEFGHTVLLIPIPIFNWSILSSPYGIVTRPVLC